MKDKKLEKREQLLVNGEERDCVRVQTLDRSHGKEEITRETDRVRLRGSGICRTFPNLNFYNELVRWHQKILAKVHHKLKILQKGFFSKQCQTPQNDFDSYNPFDIVAHRIDN